MNTIVSPDTFHHSRCSDLIFSIILLLLLLPFGYTAAGEREDQFRSVALEGGDEPETAVQSWLFPQAGRRLPLKERRLYDGAQRGLIPPRTTDRGFTPRIGAAVEYQDNLFFTNDNQRDDVIAVLSPGVRYSNGGKGWNLEADYGFEAARYFDNSRLNKVFDAQSGVLFANRELSRRFTVELADIFLGLLGGAAGSLNRLELRQPDGTVRRPRSKEIVRDLPRGTLLYQEAGGGGGYGEPFERPAELVAEEVRQGVISIAAARRDYGVVIDPETLALDAAATRKLRGERR